MTVRSCCSTQLTTDKRTRGSPSRESSRLLPRCEQPFETRPFTESRLFASPDGEGSVAVRGYGRAQAPHLAHKSLRLASQSFVRPSSREQRIVCCNISLAPCYVSFGHRMRHRWISHVLTSGVEKLILRGAKNIRSFDPPDRCIVRSSTHRQCAPTDALVLMKNNANMKDTRTGIPYA